MFLLTEVVQYRNTVEVWEKCCVPQFFWVLSDFHNVLNERNMGNIYILFGKFPAEKKKNN